MLFIGTEGEQVGGFLEQGAQVEIDDLEIELAGLDLGKVENVVDQPQQSIGAVADGLGKLQLTLVKWCFQQQAAHADHAIHRRADLVRHIGQELALGDAGHLRLGRQFPGLGGRHLELAIDCPCLQQQHVLLLFAGKQARLLGVDVGIGAAQHDKDKPQQQRQQADRRATRQRQRAPERGILGRHIAHRQQITYRLAGGVIEGGYERIPAMAVDGNIVREHVVRLAALRVVIGQFEEGLRRFPVG